MIPALLYEARPTRGPYQPNVIRPRNGGQPGAPSIHPPPPPHGSSAPAKEIDDAALRRRAHAALSFPPLHRPQVQRTWRRHAPR